MGLYLGTWNTSNSRASSIFNVPNCMCISLATPEPCCGENLGTQLVVSSETCHLKLLQPENYIHGDSPETDPLGEHFAGSKLETKNWSKKTFIKGGMKLAPRGFLMLRFVGNLNSHFLGSKKHSQTFNPRDPIPL